MGLEYFPMVGCPVQAGEGMTHSTFRVLGKMRAMAAELERVGPEVAQAQGKPLEEIKLTLPFDFETWEEGRPSETTIGEFLARWTALAGKLLPICSDCPLNQAGAAVGCYAAITYPISAAGEAWLMERFNPPDGDTGYLPHHFDSAGATGQRLDAGRPGSLFEAPEPVVKRLAPAGRVFSSSQVIEYLLMCAPSLIPQTLFALCVSFGAIEIKPGQAEFIAMNLGLIQMAGGGLTNGMSIADWKRQLRTEHPFILVADPGDDRSVFKFKQFLWVCWNAFCLDGELIVDG